MGFYGLKKWFKFDLDNDLKEEYDVIINKLNVCRAKAVSYVLILIQVILIIFYMQPKAYKILTLSVKYYFTMSAIMLVFTPIFLFIIIPLGKDIRKNLKLVKIVGFIFTFIVLAWCMVTALLYQQSSGQVTVYITGIFAISILTIYHPLRMFFLLMPIHMMFIILLPHFQATPGLVFEHNVITTVDILVSLIVSREFYKNKLNDFITKKSFQQQNILLSKTNLELEKVNHKLELLSYTDSLTSLLNRRRFDEMIHMEWERCKRYSIPISLIMIDIDYYKNYNDFYGHQAGDECIVKITKAISDLVHRSSDIIARYGGEEFVIGLPHIECDKAYQIAENIRTTVEDIKIPHEKSNVSKYVTISLGVSTITPNKEFSYKDLIESADMALYKAKVKRNHTVSLENKQF